MEIIDEFSGDVKNKLMWEVTDPNKISCPQCGNPCIEATNTIQFEDGEILIVTCKCKLRFKVVVERPIKVKYFWFSDGNEIIR